MANAKYFEPHQIAALKAQLEGLDDTKFINIQSAQLKDPTTLLIVSLLGGSLGIDRFMLGDTGLGIAKLLTCGGFGIWTIVDWFTIQGKTRQYNAETIQRAIAGVF